MATEGNCPGCGRLLEADALKGLCPECLMKAGFGTGAAPAPDAPTGRAAFTPPSLAEVARLFPQLEVAEALGQGGMGAVYKARQPALDRWVALKVLPPQTAVKADFSERFNREARALARLNHPHIVAVHEFGQAGGLPYFIMEYVDGVTLRQLVQAKKLAPERALAIVPQICEALQFAHDEGVVHRDIKPENILLDKKGRVKIADFGIAKIVEGEKAGQQTITGDQQIIGTPHYMAPEQVERPHLVDHRADIYSLGVVFYEMLTGELPLGKFAPPSGKVQVDVRLDEVVLHALEKEPERRYQQASELKTDVETIATSASSGGQGAAGREGQAGGREMTFRAFGQYNPWELAITILGSVFFVVMLLMSPAFPRPFTWPLVVICIFGLGICALTWAGLWPFPSPFFPEPNFSSRNLRRGRATTVVALVALLLLAVPLVSMLFYQAVRQAPDLGPASRERVIHAETALRRAILDRLAEGGWKSESLSVSVSPDLRRAECRFGRVWKNGLTQDTFNAGIRLVPQGEGLWLVEGTGEFRALRFSVDTSLGSGAVASAPGATPTLPEGRSERPPVTYETVAVTRGPLTMQIREAGKLNPRPDDPAQWQVDADLPETSVVHVKVGQEVECLADAFPSRVFKGKVTRVADGPEPGQEPAIYSAVVDVTNPELEFRRGMSVRLSFILAHRPNALRIPVQALLFRLSGDATVSTNLSFGLSPNELAMRDAAERAARTVWVMRGESEAEPVQIRIGITDSAFTEVTSGLREGECVVIGKTTTNSETQSDGRAELASRKNTNTVGFRPAIERVLKAKEECFLDLDTGQTHGPAIIGGETDLPPGMDLSIPYAPVGADFRADRVVALDHLEVQPATNTDWDLSPSELSERLKSFDSQVIGGLRPRELANQQSELPRTCLFRTSQWSEGVLQIVAFTWDPPGVKLRYKFLPYGLPRRLTRQVTFGPARRLAAVWPDGISIELVGLSQYPSKGGKSWRADGYELPSPPFDESTVDIRSYAPPGTRPVQLFFSITGLKSGPGSEAKLDLSNAFWTGRKYKQGVWQPDIKAIGLQVPTNARSIHATLVLNAAEQLRMIWSLRTNVWLTDAASLLPAPLAKGERAVAFMYVSLRPGYATFPQVRLVEQASVEEARRGMVTTIYALKPGEAGRLLGSIKSMIGAAGEAVSDERSNSIIVSASPTLQEGVAQLLQQSGALENSVRPSRRALKADDESLQNTNTAGFGPVVELLLDFDTRKPTAYLDLDTGKYLDPAFKFPLGMDSTPAGVDLRASVYEGDTQARLAINMALKPVATNRWEATPAEIRKELAMARRQAEVRLVASEVPQLFFFRTSEGGQGILQLQVGSMVDGTHQVHIRYKLLSPSAPGMSSAPGDGADVSAPLRPGLTPPSPWADPNLSDGLAALVWRALAEPLEVEGQRYVWLSATLAPPACVVRGEFSGGDPSDGNDWWRGRGVTLYFVAVNELATPQVCGALVEAVKPFEVNNLPAGQYYLIAIANPTHEGLFDEIGVPTPWRILEATLAKPIEGLKVQKSQELTSWVRRSFRFDSGLSHLNAENIETEPLGPHGRVVDHAGRAIPGAEIQVREFAPGQSSFAAPDTRANYQGYYGLPPVAFRYHACANVHWPLSNAVGVRWQTLRREKILDGKQRVDFAFPPWPTDAKGVGKIKGRVTDREGQPVSGCLVEIRPDRVWPKITEASDGWFSEWGIRVFVDKGEFAADGVQVGGCVVRLLDSSGGESGVRMLEMEPGGQATLRFVVEKQAALPGETGS